MGMPSIDIQFVSTAQSAVRRSQSGIVAVIVLDAAASGGLVLTDAKQIPSALAASNQAYIRRAFIGYENAPKKVLCYVLPDDAADYSDALDWLAVQQFDYLAAPPDVTATECAAIRAWILEQRTHNKATYKAVLPDTSADSEAIINFSTGGIKVGNDTFDAAAYCSRIAGMLAGTPLTYSCTYAYLPEVEDVERMTSAEMDAAVDAGEFILFWDGLRVKTGRAVNSLTTLTADKTAAYKKIKVVEAMDLMQTDLHRLFSDNWIGKIANSYDNRILLITAVKSYFAELETLGVLASGSSAVDFDVEEIRQWLESAGVDVSEMTDKEIMQADTGSEVFMTSSAKILDAIEDIKQKISI